MYIKALALGLALVGSMQSSLAVPPGVSGGSWIGSAMLAICAMQVFQPMRTMTKLYKNVVTPKIKVGVVTVAGEIRESSQAVHELKSFLERGEIKAVVLKIDSPGGLPGAAQALYHEIRELSRKYNKPIVVWVENLAVSAAYYIASAADYIICTPSALVGSIGVVMAFPNLKEFIEQFKIHYTILTAGKYKAAGNQFNELTAEQKTMFSDLNKETHERFKQDVIMARKQLANIDSALWGEGQPMTGDTALALGLVDELGSQSTVEAYVKNRLGVVAATDIEWVQPPKKTALARFLEGSNGGDYPSLSFALEYALSRFGLVTEAPLRL
jgi:protease-4